MPCSFLSNPEVAESRIDFSDSRELEKDCDDALRAEAIESSEEVRDSCSVRLCVKRASVVGEIDKPVVVADGLRSSSLSA